MLLGKKKKPSTWRRVLKSLLSLSQKEFIHNSRLHSFPLAAPGIICIKSRWKKPVSVGFAWKWYRGVSCESPLGRGAEGKGKGIN